MNKATVANLGAINKFGRQKEKTDWTPDDAMVLLCQITFALLMIFVMMYVVNKAKSDEVLMEATGQLQNYREKIKVYQSTDIGKAIEKLEQTAELLQRQKLLDKLKDFEAKERGKMSLNKYLKTDEKDNEKIIDISGVLAGDQIADQNFITGWQYAFTQFANPEKMKKYWSTQTLMTAKMTLTKDTLTNWEVVTAANAVWLIEEIRRRFDSIKNDALNVQGQIVAGLITYYQTNPRALEGTALYVLVKDYNKALPEKQNQLNDLIYQGLQDYAKSFFEQKGVKLLSDT